MKSPQPHAAGGSIFGFLAKLFRKHDVRAVLVGGYAMNVYQVQRMTFDVDFVVTADEAARLEPDLLAAGYAVFNRSKAFVQFKSQTAGLRDLDLLICDRHTVGRLLDNGNEVSIAGERFVVPSPHHLIAMKLHAISGNREREIKDFPDLVSLIRTTRLDPADESVKSIFVRHGAMELYARILEVIGGTHDR